MNVLNKVTISEEDKRSQLTLWRPCARDGGEGAGTLCGSTASQLQAFYFSRAPFRLTKKDVNSFTLTARQRLDIIPLRNNIFTYIKRHLLPEIIRMRKTFSSN